MGRKPNQLILEFFERGQKLEDASNRYQHTCKACGDLFPKGRIDSLTTHLFKKCQVISLRDRQRALLQLHELPDLESPDGNKSQGTVSHGNGNGNGNTLRSGIRKGESLDLPIATRNWTPLDTLAEVSRYEVSRNRVVDEHMLPKQADAQLSQVLEPSQDQPSGNHDPVLRLAQTQGDLLDDSTNCFEFTSNDALLPPMQAQGQYLTSPLSSSRLPGLTLQPGEEEEERARIPMLAVEEPSPDQRNVFPKPGLLLEPELNEVSRSDTARISDKLFNPQLGSQRPSSTWPMATQDAQHLDILSFDEGADPTLIDGVSSTERAATFPRPIAINPHDRQQELSTDFNTSIRAARPKVRGRFSASRRKEVQEVRKRGACIRCRMLKKPCSGESPCSTCKNVESARLWKQPCVRTRIAEELKIYSAGLHSVLEFREMAPLKENLHFERLPGRIELTHFLDTSTYVRFDGLKGRRRKTAGPLSQNDPAERHGIRILDWEVEDLQGKLEEYITEMASTFFDREPSAFVKSTLKLASDLSNQKKDTLLTRVLEAWLINHVIVDLEMRWLAFENSNSDASAGQREAIDDETDRASYRSICVQLKSAAEKRAAQLSKMVMNELERRLLQRAQSGWFETFLVAICLLSCVERSCWLFRTWDDPSHEREWPLDQRPSYYYRQGERFADLLHMLLRMRGLPQKAYARAEDGVLSTDSDDTARDYFSSIQLTVADLEKRQNAIFDPKDSRSLELRFCSKLLLPT